MGEQTLDGISWCDFTFNPWWGCTPVEGSPACAPAKGEKGAKCYAWTWAERCGYNDKEPVEGKLKTKFPIWGADVGRRDFGDKHWNELHKWNREWALEGMPERRGRVFIMSMGDWAEGRPDQVEPLARLWVLCEQTPLLDKLMLTKRPQLISKLCPLTLNPRIWQGTTAENQYWFDLRWRHLREVESYIKWFSLEPQVGPIKLAQDFLDLGPRGWVVVGGQSGADYVDFDPAWARYTRDQCKESGTRFHMKQMSGNTKKQLHAIPADLMIREWPDSILKGIL